MKDKRNLIINSMMCYILAFICTTICHELAHALAGLFSNSEPVMYHNYVEHLSTTHLSISQKTGIALAGPLSSLLQGLLAGGWFLSTKKRGLTQLFILWLSILGFNNFLGYIMTAPLFQEGDIGKIYLLLDTSLLIQLVYTFFAAIGLLIVANRMSRPFLEFSYQESWIKPEKNAKNFSFSMIMLPWMLGSVVITFLYLPIINVLSIIYPVMSGMIFIYPWQNAVRVKNIRLSTDHRLGGFSLVLFGFLVVLISIFRWILPTGIAM